MGIDLRGKTLGVVGAGNIGLHVIRIARAFDMNVLAYDLRPQPILTDVLGFRSTLLEELLQASDVVSLHVPYAASNHHLLNRERFAQMKRRSLLINTARGGVVDTEALLWALDQGIVGGVGLDVIEGEALLSEERQLLAMPTAEEKLQAVLRRHALLRYENVMFTPHMAFYSREALQRIMDTTIANVQAFLSGTPQNVVS
ncbi:MAG: hypothetical protein NTZ05_09025 [Chloroflexi bacterium]|nr:hypothetical protein [Chloroflexota bacterium]